MLFWLAPIASILALGFAWYFYRQMMKESEGTPQMMKIAAAVRKGAMSYLRQQYKIVGWVFLGLVILFSVMAYGFGVQNPWVPVAFLTGGLFSGLSGFLGMKTATYAYVAVFIPKNPDNPEKRPPVRNATGTHGFCTPKPYAMTENRITNPRNTQPTILYC